MIFKGYIFSYGFIALVFAVGVVLQKLNLIKGEGARKFIHIMVCFTWVIMEKYFGQTVHKVIVPLTFIAVNWLSVKKHLVPGMDRDEESYGTVFYAVALTVMNFAAYLNPDRVLPAGLGIFALSFGDGLAALFGKIKCKYNKKIVPGKSIFGTTACFVFSFVGILIVCSIMGYNIGVGVMLCLSLVSTVMEFIGGSYDNMIIPFGVFMATLIIL